MNRCSNDLNGNYQFCKRSEGPAVTGTAGNISTSLEKRLSLEIFLKSYLWTQVSKIFDNITVFTFQSIIENTTFMTPVYLSFIVFSKSM